MRAFQLNENFIQRWPRFQELRSQVLSAGTEACVAHFGLHDWRDRLRQWRLEVHAGEASERR
jgi:hypothetical protein